MKILMFTGFTPAGLRRIGQRLNEKLNYQHLSLTSLLLEKLAEQTPMGQLFRCHMDKGELLLSPLVPEMVENAVRKSVEEKKILIDGYPRSRHQAELLLDFLLQNQDNEVRSIFLYTPKASYIARLKSRNLWEDSDEKLDSSIMERLNNMEREAIELKTYLESRIEVITIDGVGAMEEVTNRLLAALKV